MKKKILFLVILFLFILFPQVNAAKISGYVIDSQDNLIKHAKVKIFCLNMDFYINTDDFGFFEVNNISNGECNLIAVSNDKLCKTNLNLSLNKTYLVELKLAEEESKSYYHIINIIIFLLFLLFFFSIFYFKKNKILKFTKKKDDSNIILKTLNEAEKLIIEQVKIKGPLTQSQIRYYTAIPKSSLHRILSKLENKNLILFKEEAGVKKIILSDLLSKKNK